MIPRVFVTGCPRSGTSLMQVLLPAIPDFHGSFEEVAPQPHARPGSVIKHPYRPKNRSDITVALGLGYHVVIMVRDGRDVMVSRDPHDPDAYYIKRSDEWCSAYEYQVRPFLDGNPNVTIVRYEELVREPVSMIAWMAKRLGCSAPRDLNVQLTRVPITSTFYPAMRGQREITTAHIGQWRRDKKRIAALVANPGIRERMCLGLEALKYETDREWLREL